MGTTNCENEPDEIELMSACFPSVDCRQCMDRFRREAVAMPDPAELADTEPAPSAPPTLPAGSIPGVAPLPKGFTGTAAIPFSGVDGFDELRESDT